MLKILLSILKLTANSYLNTSITCEMHINFWIFLSSFQEDRLYLPTVYMKIDLDEKWWVVSLYAIPLVDSFFETHFNNVFNFLIESE